MGDDMKRDFAVGRAMRRQKPGDVHKFLGSRWNFTAQEERVSAGGEIHWCLAEVAVEFWMEYADALYRRAMLAEGLSRDVHLRDAGSGHRPTVGGLFTLSLNPLPRSPR